MHCAGLSEQRQVAACSDRIVEELQRADLIVIGSPMYNFGITSQLKAWFDAVVRAGKTFRYTDAGPEGLLKGKRDIVAESRGGFYSVGPRAEFDHQEPHLKTLLAFIGIDDVQFIRAEGLDMGRESRADGLAHARGACRAGTWRLLMKWRLEYPFRLATPVSDRIQLIGSGHLASPDRLARAEDRHRPNWQTAPVGDGATWRNTCSFMRPCLEHQAGN